MAEGVHIAGEVLANNISTDGGGNDRIRSACDSHISVAELSPAAAASSWSSDRALGSHTLQSPGLR